MDQERERVQADLRGLLEGEVRCDDLFVQMYATDASIYEIQPLGIVRPRGLSDVVAVVKYAAENNIPIHARGAGTGVAGESLGRGLIVDFSHHMRRLLEIGEDTVRIQPGIIHAQLNRQLHAHGRLFGPDPATRSVTTMGSVLALDGGGSHWLQYGSARHKVVSLQVVLADGQVIQAEPTPVVSPPADENSPPSSAIVRRAELVSRVTDLLTRDAALIQGHRTRSLVNRAGYHLYDLLGNGQLDLARLIVGSEGTLGLITEAVVKTDPIAQHRGVVLLFFDRMDAAAQAAVQISKMGASACDLMDRRLLTIARESDVRFDVLIPRDAEAMLLVEYHGDDPQAVQDSLRAIISRFHREHKLAFDSRLTMETDERNLYWRISRRFVPTLYRLKGHTRPLPFVEDIAIPPDYLPEFLVRMQNVLKAQQVTATVFAHAGHGQLHIRPFLDLANAEHVRKMQFLADDLYQIVLDAGGTISGEHGVGLSRTWFVQRQYGPLYDTFREVKRIFDPQNIFNPGKVVAEAPQPLTKNLRHVVGVGIDAPNDPTTPVMDVPERFSLQLAWPGEGITYAARTCNGCGRCRTLAPDERMCPLFRFAPREEASPRSKANLMMAIMTGQLDSSHLAGDGLKAIADLCVNCHSCRLECPATVDIPKLMVECKGQYVAVNGLRVKDWMMARLDRVSSVAAHFATVGNWALSNRPMRWLLEKCIGVAQERKVPRLARRTFLRWAHRRRLTRPPKKNEGPKVLYFVDIYANWYDTQLGEAFVKILKHHGISVYVHPEQFQAGMAALSMGALHIARKLAHKNLRILADAVRQGYEIVTTEPSAALCLTHEYVNLTDSDDARLVSANTHEACAYLWKLHQTGKLHLNLNPINSVIGYHQPCHMRALGAGTAGLNLLQLIPGVQAAHIERGCSGMAGTYGLQRKNYRNSLRAGWGLITAMRDPGLQLGSTECSACKMQMEQGTSKPTIHPLKLLAYSYGLMPEVEKLLTARGEELNVT